MKIMTIDEFKSEIKSQKVPIEKVTFQCPACLSIQSAEDLIAAGVGKDLDEVENFVAFSCIGRWNKDKGCDWTLGGLFQIHELEVIDSEGKKHPCFIPIKRLEDQLWEK